MENENGVSEIAGAILLVALVILAMMIVAVALLSQPPPREIPQVNAVAGNNTSYIFVRHNGGDPLTPLETIVRIDGNPDPVPNDQILLRYENGTQANWTTQDWTVGTTLVIPDSRTPQSVSLIYNGGSSQALLLTATFTETPASVAPTLPPGSYHTIISSAGTGGRISPSGPVQVPNGGFQNFVITPDPCYRISGVIVDGSPAGAVSSYSFNNVQADHTISASFTLNDLAISASAGTGGTIAPNGTVPASCGGAKTFNIINNSGYWIQNILVDGSSIGPVTTYTFNNIVVNHTISATFTNTPPYCLPLITSFTANQTTGPVPLVVQFNDTSSGVPNSWLWTFGDGTSSDLQNPIKIYSNPGSYNVSLTASNSTCLSSNSTTKYNYINPTCIQVLANFTGSPRTGPIPLDVQFTDLSTGSPTTWMWNFGDGGTSTQQNPLHRYTVSGLYSVTLNASNGCSSQTMTRSNYITPYQYFSGSVINLTKTCGSLGYMLDGTYYQFDAGSQDTITINGVSINIPNGATVRLEIKGNQTSGRLVMDHPNLYEFAFNVNLYINGNLMGSGYVSQISASVSKNSDSSTLTYVLEPCESYTHLIINSDDIINGNNASRIEINVMHIIHDNVDPYVNLFIVDLQESYNHINTQGNIKLY